MDVPALILSCLETYVVVPAVMILVFLQSILAGRIWYTSTFPRTSIYQDQYLYISTIPKNLVRYGGGFAAHI